MKKEYRYIIKGEAFAWQSLADTTTEKLKAVAERLTKWYGNTWQIEFREV